MVILRQFLHVSIELDEIYLMIYRFVFFMPSRERHVRTVFGNQTEIGQNLTHFKIGITKIIKIGQIWYHSVDFNEENPKRLRFFDSISRTGDICKKEVV